MRSRNQREDPVPHPEGPTRPQHGKSVYPIRVIVVYYSRFGAIQTLAEQIAEGARQVGGVEARLLHADEWHIGESRPQITDGPGAQRAAVLNQMTSADAIIAGSPGYFGSMASPLKRLFEECLTAARPPTVDRTRPWRAYQFRNKIGAAFTATATPHGGNEQTLHSILTLLMHLGMIVVTPGQGQPILENEAAPYGPTAITGPTGDWAPTEQVLAQARDLGQSVAQVALWLRLGQVRWPSDAVKLATGPSPQGL